MSQFSSDLPADTDLNNSRRQVFNASFSYVKPTEFPKGHLIHLNKQLFEELNLPKDYKKILTSEQLNTSFNSYAMNYAGHQFGQWAGQLGDGRAITIDHREHFDLQLKGAGLTPYSRGGDGLAVLRSSVREYLCSEAMFNLGIPTTRALSLALTGEKVARDMMYNGNVQYELGAIVCRVAKSFVRFGSFEIHAARKENDILEKLINHVYGNFYSDHIPSSNVKDNALAVFKNITRRSLDLVINWERVGFIHGVLNTDNMSIIGDTIDFGPFGWVERYDPDWTPNTSDTQGRYSFAQQGEIVLWNLLRLANALYPVIKDTNSLEDQLNWFKTNYSEAHDQMMNKKLGLKNSSNDFVNLTESLLKKYEQDYTIFFRNLSRVNMNSSFDFFVDILQDSSYDLQLLQKDDLLQKWFNEYISHLKVSELENRILKMEAVNPVFILRNHLLYECSKDLESGNKELFEQLNKALKTPYEVNENTKPFFVKAPDWSFNTIGCSQLSCSS